MRHEHGFTLIETVLALLIMSLALVPIFGAARGTISLMTEGRVQARMALTLGQQLDRARLAAGPPCAGAQSASGLVNGVSYRRTLMPSGGFGRVTATVTASLPGRTLHDTLTRAAGCP